ncbi:TPA: hypothetical protein SIF59_004034 [Escherichia coli]|nr:hypothetical protein [Escherichia coli]HEI0663047.1 hypothetical protein [Escherichia coli]
MSLNMKGHIDAVFKSVDATHVGKSGAYVDGIWTETTSAPVSFQVDIQPLNDKEIDFLRQGGERIIDPRKIYVNSGDLNSIQLAGEWVFLGQRWKIVKTDNRPWRNYCKVVVDRLDVQS